MKLNKVIAVLFCFLFVVSLCQAEVVSQKDKFTYNYRLGQNYYSLGDDTLAFQYADEAAQHAYNYGSRGAQSKLYFYLGKLDYPIKEYEEIIEHDFNNYYAYWYLALTYAKFGDYWKSINKFDRGLVLINIKLTLEKDNKALMKENDQAHADRAYVNYLRGDIKKSIENWDNVGNENEPKLHKVKGLVFRPQGDTEAGCRELYLAVKERELSRGENMEAIEALDKFCPKSEFNKRAKKIVNEDLQFIFSRRDEATDAAKGYVEFWRARCEDDADLNLKVFTIRDGREVSLGTAQALNIKSEGLSRLMLGLPVGKQEFVLRAGESNAKFNLEVKEGKIIPVRVQILSKSATGYGSSFFIETITQSDYPVEVKPEDNEFLAVELGTADWGRQLYAMERLAQLEELISKDAVFKMKSLEQDSLHCYVRSLAPDVVKRHEIIVAEVKAYQAKEREYKAKQAEYNQKLLELKEKLAIYQEKLGDYNQVDSELNAKNNELDKESLKLKNNNINLKKTKKEVKKEQAALKRKKKRPPKKQEQMEAHLEVIKLAEEKIENLESDIETIGKEIEVRSQIIKEKQSEVKELTSLLAAKDAIVQEKDAQVKAKEKEVDIKELELKAKKKELDEQGRILAKAQAIYRDWKNNLLKNKQPLRRVY